MNGWVPVRRARSAKLEFGCEPALGDGTERRQDRQPFGRDLHGPAHGSDSEGTTEEPDRHRGVVGLHVHVPVVGPEPARRARPHELREDVLPETMLELSTDGGRLERELAVPDEDERRHGGIVKMEPPI